jgi:hypothetical protein
MSEEVHLYAIRETMGSYRRPTETRERLPEFMDGIWRVLNYNTPELIEAVQKAIAEAKAQTMINLIKAQEPTNIDFEKLKAEIIESTLNRMKQPKPAEPPIAQANIPV